MKRQPRTYSLRKDLKDLVVLNSNGTLTVWFGDEPNRVYLDLDRTDARLLARRINQALDAK